MTEAAETATVATEATKQQTEVSNLLALFAAENKTQHALLTDLASDQYGQAHLFDRFVTTKKKKISPVALRKLGDQLESLDAAYPGGLREYIDKAQTLLTSE